MVVVNPTFGPRRFVRRAHVIHSFPYIDTKDVRDGHDFCPPKIIFINNIEGNIKHVQGEDYDP